MTLSNIITEKLKRFAEEITATFALPITCNPEDHAEKLGRPDMGAPNAGNCMSVVN